MVKRKIIEIDETMCNGCGQCIPNCPEGALQMIDGKARLVSDLACDGLGACIGHCPQGAIRIIERKAEAYDERKVMENIVKQGSGTIKAHLKHLHEHNQHKYFDEAVAYLEKKGIENPLAADGNTKTGKPLPCGCPGSAMKDMRYEGEQNSTQGLGSGSANSPGAEKTRESQLRQWPVQLTLLPPSAPFFDGADLLIAADCVPFAYADFHCKLLRGKSVVVGCPKLDDLESYKEKLTELFKMSDVKSVTVAIMEVPCCGGILSAAEQAIADSGKDIPLSQVVISVSGEEQ